MATKEIKQFDSVDWSGLYKAFSGVRTPPDALLGMDHLEWHLGYARRSRKLNLFGGGVVGIPLAITMYQKADGTYLLMCITSEKLYSWTSASTGWEDEGTYTGSSSRAISFSEFAGTFIFTDDTNYVKSFDGTTLANLAGLTNTAARACTSFWSFFFLLHTTESGTENPYRVKWSNVGDATDWSAGLASFVDLIDGMGEVRSGAVLGNRLLVYKERNIYEGAYVGLPLIFDFNPATTRTGLLAPRTLALGEGFHFFLGVDNVYAFDGRTPQPIGEGIAELLFGPRAITTSDNIGNSFGMYIERLREYWLAVPTGQEAYPNQIYRYHVPSRTWWPRSRSGYYRSLGDWFDTDLLIWTDLANTWENFGAAETWQDLGGLSQLVRIPLVGVPNGANGLIYYIDESETTTETAYFETKDYIFHVLTRILEYRVEAKGATGTLTAYYSIDEGATWVSMGVKSLNGGWEWLKWTLNLTSEVVRFKVEISTNDISVRKRTVIGIEKRR